MAELPELSGLPGRPLGVAVIGYSFMGRAHSNAWRNVGSFYPDVPPVTQQVLVGRDEAAVKEAARHHGWATHATDWREAIARDDVDIVDVCTPGLLHAEVAIAALEAGKHVLVEKPLANDVAGAEAMVAAAGRACREGVSSMVGFNYRRVPALALARRMIEQGQIGDVRQVRVSYLQDWLADAQAPMTWRLRKESAGSGSLGDLGSHAVDQVQFLLGTQVTSVTGSLRTFVTERPGPDGPEQVTVDDAAWATLHLANSAVASVETSRMATGRKNALEIEVYGTEGALAFDLERLNELQVTRSGARGTSRVLVTEADDPYAGAWWPPGHVLGWDHTFTSQAADFLRCIAAGSEPCPTFADGLSVQRVLAGIEESSRLDGARVDISS